MTRKRLIIYLIGSMAATISMAFTNRDEFGICPLFDMNYCYNTITTPIFFILLTMVSFFLIKLITRSDVLNSRKKLIIYLTSSVVAAAGVFLYAIMGYAGICPPINRKYCDIVDITIFFTLLIIASVFLIKLIVQPRVFASWKKFVVIYIPIVVLLMAIPSDCGSICFDDALPPLFGIIYVVVSLIIIIKKSRKLRKEKIASIQKKP